MDSSILTSSTFLEFEKSGSSVDLGLIVNLRLVCSVALRYAQRVCVWLNFDEWGHGYLCLWIARNY